MPDFSVGDYVVPHYPEFPNVRLTPCRVRAVYKNGKLRALSDEGRVEYIGPSNWFKEARP